MSYKGNSLTWTMGRQLASYGNNTYTYNEEGIRTSKTVGGVVTKYYLDGSDIIEQTNNSATLYFFYDRNGEIIGFESGNANYFYVKNAQKDIVAIADSTGEVIAEYTYDPWGAVTSVTGSNTTIGNLNPFRYRSYYYDTEIGMYYLQSRYYDPELCRFINADSWEYIRATGTPLSFNLFAYCENNGINLTDNNGCYATSNRVISGNAYSFNYTGSYRALYNSYRLSVSVGGVSVFSDYESGILKIWNAQSNIKSIFKTGRTMTFAYVIKKLSRILSTESLAGRTDKGIAYELICHFIWYKKNMLKSHTKVTDCGATTGKLGRDNNAQIFEKDKGKFNKVQTLVKKNNWTAASLEIASTLLKLGWQKYS